MKLYSFLLGISTSLILMALAVVGFNYVMAFQLSGASIVTSIVGLYALKINA